MNCSSKERSKHRQTPNKNSSDPTVGVHCAFRANPINGTASFLAPNKAKNLRYEDAWRHKVHDVSFDTANCQGVEKESLCTLMGCTFVDLKCLDNVFPYKVKNLKGNI